MKVKTWKYIIEEDGLEYPDYISFGENDKDMDVFYNDYIKRAIVLNLQGNSLTRVMRERLHNLKGCLVTDIIFNKSENHFTLYSLITMEFKTFSR